MLPGETFTESQPQLNPGGSQGAAFVVFEFDSAAGDPVPEDFAISLAQKQAENIKSALG